MAAFFRAGLLGGRHGALRAGAGLGAVGAGFLGQRVAVESAEPGDQMDFHQGGRRTQTPRLVAPTILTLRPGGRPGRPLRLWQRSLTLRVLAQYRQQT